jgi:hypothetical protein
LGRTDCNARALTPKDFKHVRPALEHLVALEVLERERKPGRGKDSDGVELSIRECQRSRDAAL